MISTKEAHQSAKFQISHCSRKISPNLYLDRFLLLKVDKNSPKKVKRSCISWHWRWLKSDAKFEEKLTCCLKNYMRNMANFHQSTWKSQNWDFDRILLSKAESEDPFIKSRKRMSLNLQRSYVSWQWQMQNLKRNWLWIEFKIDMKNLTKFDLSTRKSWKFAF